MTHVVTGGGDWTIPVASDQQLAAGEWRYSVKMTDVAGNETSQVTTTAAAILLLYFD